MITSSVLAESSTAVEMTEAILLFSQKGDRNATPMYATVNEVYVKDGQYTIGAGKSLSQGKVIEIFSSLAKQKKSATFLPENTLLTSAGETMWWIPPGTHTLWFKDQHLRSDENGSAVAFSAPIPLPGLIFMMTASRNLCVLAFKGNCRPTPDTEIFIAPVLNVWESGKLCTGNIRRPAATGPQSIGAWEMAFFRSYFTHSNVDTLVNYEGDYQALYKDLIEGKFQTFPEEVLIPSKKKDIKGFLREYYKD